MNNRPKPLRILFFLEYYFPNIGGVETLFKGLIDSLAKDGHKITVVTARPYSNTPLKESDGNISIIRIPIRSRYLFTFLGFFYLVRHINKGDFVHTTSYNAALSAFFASKLFRKKVVVTFHEVWDQLWFKLPYMGTIGRWGHYLFEKLLLKLPFDKFIGVSKSTSNNLAKAGVDSKRIATIYNGLDYQDFELVKPVKEHQEKHYVYTFFGRLGISKGLDLLLPAAFEICEKYTDARLQLIIPKVPPFFLKRIKDTIESSDVKDQIIIKHELSFTELKETLVLSNCVVIPSYSEGFCFAATECIALNVPIISSDQAALKEVVSGQFIKMKEFTVKGLVQAMDTAYQNAWEFSPIKKFTLQESIEQYKKLYLELMDQPDSTFSKRQTVI